MIRLFNLDAQTLADVAIQAINIFVLFILLSYLLFNPTRKLLEERKKKIKNEFDVVEKEKEHAIALKAMYDAKLRDINKEAEIILKDARRLARNNETKIIEEAKLEAKGIIERANGEIELEKIRAVDEMKQEIIAIASLMAGKVLENAMDETTQAILIEESIKEMGDNLWLS